MAGKENPNHASRSPGCARLSHKSSSRLRRTIRQVSSHARVFGKRNESRKPDTRWEFKEWKCGCAEMQTHRRKGRVEGVREGK